MKIKTILFFLLITSLLYSKSIPLYFHGNTYFKDRQLYELLNLYEPYSYEFYKDEPKINPKIVPLAIETLQDFYKSKGFYHAKIVSKREKNSIVIDISANTPIKIKAIKIRSLLNIKNDIGLKVGERFDAQKFIDSKKKIKLLYQNHGYANATFNTKAYIDIKKNSAKLLYEVTPNQICTFANIDINSSKHIDKSIIRSLLYFKKGDIYSPHAIERSYKNLYAYDGISQAIIKTHIYNKKDVNVTINIQETKKPIRFQIGIGASSDEGLTALLGVKHRNFYGNLKTLSLETRVTQIKQNIKLNFTMPLAKKNMFGSEINFENENFFGFKENRILAKSYFSQRDEFNWLQEALIVDTSQSYASTDKLLFPEKSLILVSPKLSWKYDTRDKILNPSKGYFVDTQLQGSVLTPISNATYYKASIGGAYILPLPVNILATKVTIGSLHIYDGSVPNSYRFFAGGMNSNRAYGYRLLGPRDTNDNPTGFNSIIETTIEYRFHIYKSFRGVVFNDNSFIGQTYIPNNTTAYYSTGFGLRYETPIGPLAIDLGFDPKEPMRQHALHFHVGELF
jgi:translocation and assembly module TamA